MGFVGQRHCDVGQAGYRLLEQLKLFRREFRNKVCGPGHVPAGLCNGSPRTRGDGVSRRGKYDWYRRRSQFAARPRRSKGDDDIDVVAESARA